MGKRIRTNAEREELERQRADAIRLALAESDPAVQLRDGPATAGGDPVRLRGIPAIGKGVSGCVRGTDPEREATR